MPMASWSEAPPTRAPAAGGAHIDERNDGLGELWKSRDEKTASYAPAWQQARADLPPGWAVDPADPTPTDGARVGAEKPANIYNNDLPDADPVRWVVSRPDRHGGDGDSTTAGPQGNTSTIPDLRARGVSGEVLSALQSGGDRVAAALFAYLGVGAAPARTFV